MVSGRSIGKTLQTLTQSIAGSDKAQAVKQKAMQRLDQVLLGLNHKSLGLKESQDVIQRVGQSVLERAEAIRAQVANTPFSPSWLKDISFGPTTAEHADAKSPTVGEFESETETVPAEVTSMAEATVSTAANQMQPPPVRVKAKRTGAEETPMPASEVGEEILASERAAKDGDAARKVREHSNTAGTIVEAPKVEKAMRSKREAVKAQSKAAKAKGAKVKSGAGKAKGASKSPTKSNARSAKRGKQTSFEL